MSNSVNNINLQEQFLKLYLQNASNHELSEVNSYLEQRRFDLIFDKVEKYKQNLINIQDYKDSKSTSGGNSGNYSTKKMDAQTFELYCILILIDKYILEKDENKKRLLKEEIENALYYYRNFEAKKKTL